MQPGWGKEATGTEPKRPYTRGLGQIKFEATSQDQYHTTDEGLPGASPIPSTATTSPDYQQNDL